MPNLENRSVSFFTLLCVVSCAGCASPSSGEAATSGGVSPELKAKVTSHGYPSIYQAWAAADNMNHAPAKSTPLSATETSLQTMARHDLIFRDTGSLGLVWNDQKNPGLSTGFTPESIKKGLALRAQILALNPHAVLLAEIRYHDSTSGYFPDDSPWWLRDKDGNRVAKTKGTSLNGYFLIDISQPAFQDQIATLCAAAIDSGVVDGCMLDWWSDDTPVQAALARKIREKIGDRGLLLVNVNGKLPTLSAPYINGMFMEGFGASFFPDWRTAAKNLQWAATHLRPPAFTAFEMWYPKDAPVSGTTQRNDLARMRYATTLSLCNSDGYVLFSDTNYHSHDWYAFWNQTLGAPVEAVGRVNKDGSLGRNFKNGTAVFNPVDNKEVTVTFKTPVTRQSTQEVGTQFKVPAGDGEIFIYK